MGRYHYGVTSKTLPDNDSPFDGQMYQSNN